MAANTDNLLLGVGEFFVDGVDVGCTIDGVTVAKNLDVFDFRCDQVTAIVKSVVTDQTMNVSTNFEEATLANLRIVWNEEAPVQLGVPDANHNRQRIGFRKTLPAHQLIFRGFAPAPDGVDRERTYQFHKCQIFEASEHTLLRDGGLFFPVSFRILPDLALPTNEAFGHVTDRIAP